ncbi:hypothetical protein CH063_09337 [Colletotrichum higginsianum]|uniref:Uncharacterized protein n=2 Tax=Colletotrichum destructivum species complex TaxID=2707350 RepID=H1VD82_COLHI|nr:hypothetical protein CH063_09337 [Colletotrichum higginsianum]
MDSDGIEWARDESTHVDDMDSDVDSAIDEQATGQTDLLSLTSSILDYQFENGRSYHSMSQGS